MSQAAIAKPPDAISLDDTMFEGDAAHYSSVGQSALQCIRLAMMAADKRNFERILDFGAGYGRVLRVLKSAFPGAELVACDVSRDAVDFCANTFGAVPVLSSEDLGEIRIYGKFDCIWCGTLLTNLDAGANLQLLSLFESLLDKNGILVFTTHGPFVAQRMSSREFDYGIEPDGLRTVLENYDRAGFGYRDYPAEVLERLGLKKYGISVAKPSWVCQQLEGFDRLHLLSYTERAWDRHQDATACIFA